MEYQEFAPVPRLAPAVERLWTLDGHASALDGTAQPVLPDGRPELILHFGDRFDRVHADGRLEGQARTLFAGQLTSQLVLQPTGRISVLGIRFHPFGAAALLRVPQHELAGATVELDAVCASLSRAIDAVLDSAHNLEDARRFAQVALLRHFDSSLVDDRVRYATETISMRRGRVSVDGLARSVGLTRRHLERLFQVQVGLSPKRLARIARFQQALRCLESSDSPGAGALTAAACGYADQAHFIRDFRDLAGCAPTEHLMRRGVLTGFFTDKNFVEAQ